MTAVPQLDTARFVLRALQRDDARSLLPTLSDEAQCRFLSRPAFADEAELWSWLADKDWPGRTWIAVDKENGEVTGRFVAVPGHADDVVEIGYITVAGWQRRGVARECVGVLVGHLVEREGARKIVAEVGAENAPSARLLETLGFTREALFREHEVAHRGMCDVAIYGLLAREYRSAEPG